MKLAKYLKPYLKEAVAGSLFKLFEAILELILPIIVALIIDKGVGSNDIGYIFKMGAIMLFMCTLGFCSAMICQYYASKTSQGFGTILRNNLFAHISSFSHTELDKFGTSTLINRMTSDINQLQLAVAMSIRIVSRTPFICIGSLIMAIIIDVRLAIIMFIAIIIFAFILYIIMSKSAPIYSIYQKKLDRLGKILSENLLGVRVIRAFARTKFETSRFNKANSDIYATAMKVGRLSILSNPFTLLVMNMSIVAILWSGGKHINNGTLTQGEIIAFINYITQILLALVVTSYILVILIKAGASVARINEVLDITTSILENEANEVAQNDTAPIIEFKNVSFSYSKTSDYAINNISVSINKGETVGIMGGTGSGKTTFINLIMRFYDVTVGEVLFKGVNIKEYPIKLLRKSIGLVPQKSLLFSGSIKKNMQISNIDANDELLDISANIAQTSEFIDNLEEKYNSSVERGGKNFSGGEKQRLCIMRALVKTPEILILDDASSAIDYATDKKLRFAIKNSIKNCTSIIISQRIASLRHCDKILVFDNGELIAIGTHDKLFDGCGIYKEICLSQMSN